jgi:hypothetical protein
MEEREQSYFQVHGVMEYPAETPDFVQQHQTSFQKALDSFHPANRQAYNLALQIDSKYAENLDFRLRFLRCELWDPEKAAMRFVKFWQVKLELFGQQLLCKTIRQEDLSPEAQVALMDGGVQHLSVRDCAGRLVCFTCSDLVDPSRSMEARIQKLYYMAMVHSEDDSVQRNGSVYIIWKSARPFSRGTAWKVPRVLDCLPVRRNAVHVCFDPYTGKMKGLSALAKLAAEKISRYRIRIHTGMQFITEKFRGSRCRCVAHASTPAFLFNPPLLGSFVEIKYALMTFGIPAEHLPIDSNGMPFLSTDHPKKWIARRYFENRGCVPSSPLTSTNNYIINTSQVSCAASAFVTGNGIDKTSDSSPKLKDPPTGSANDEGNATSRINNVATKDREMVASIVSERKISEYDVLLGRGKSFDQHPGNLFFRSWIDRLQSQYDQAPDRTSKTSICKEIVQKIHDRNGLFLQLKEGTHGKNVVWMEVSDLTARNKVANCFRSFRRKKASQPLKSAIPVLPSSLNDGSNPDPDCKAIVNDK